MGGILRTATAGRRALDVYTTPIHMKKNRPAVILSVLCRAVDITKLEQIVFSETGSLGIRRWPAQRHILPRRVLTVTTPWGSVEGKLAELGGGHRWFSPEFESCRRLAAECDQPLRSIYRAAQQAFERSSGDPA